MNLAYLLLGITLSAVSYVFYKEIQNYKKINDLFGQCNYLNDFINNINKRLSEIDKNVNDINYQLKTDKYQDIAQLSQKIDEISNSIDKLTQFMQGIDQKFIKQCEVLAQNMQKELDVLRKDLDSLKEHKQY